MIEKSSESFRQHRDTVRSRAALVRANERIEQLELNERIDDLTQLPNRRAFKEELERRYSEVKRSLDPSGMDRRQVECSILAFDLDGFKAVNDRLGHPAGDDCLRQVGEFVKRQLRPLDFLARFSGDEFMLLLPGTDVKEAEVVAKRVLGAIHDGVTDYMRAKYPTQDPEIPHMQISASVGIVSLQQERTNDGEIPSTAELVQRADYTSYVAKRAGGDALLTFAETKKYDETGEMRTDFLREKNQ